MSGNFMLDTAVHDAGGKLKATLSPAWEIWGPNGGYISSIALRAAGRIAPPSHRPSSYTCQYLSRAEFGEIDIEVEPVRTGSTAWCLNVALFQDGKRFAQAQIWTTGKTDGPQVQDIRFPDVPGPEQCPTPQSKGTAPHPFWQNFEQRWVGETPMLRNPDGPRLQRWLRYRDFGATDDPFASGARALLLIDTLLWPAHWRGVGGDLDYIAPSLDIAAWFHDPMIDADWLLADVHAGRAAGGLIYGEARIWSEDRRLLASGGGQMLHLPLRR